MSKRLRNGLAFKLMPIESLGPNFWANLKHGLLDNYQASARHILDNFHGLDQYLLFLRSQNVDEFSISNQGSQNARSALIELVILYDSCISTMMRHYQIRCQSQELNEIHIFSSPEDGLSQLLKGVDLTSEFQSLRNRMLLFRQLRNQFAHFPLGTFIFSAKQDNFESFLKGLDGIILQGNFHCLIDKKPGVLLQYSIHSPNFVIEFFNNSCQFIELLIKVLFEDLNPNYQESS